MPDKIGVLVTEDDEAVRELIVWQLASAGYEIREAENGAEALKRLAEAWPVAMVLDLNMPVLDGFGVLDALPAIAAGRGLPVLVLTARDQGGDVARAFQLGAKDYLVKPFSQSDLLARVARLLRKPVASPWDDPETPS